MPSGMAASMRECIAHEDIDQLELETSAKSKTGYRNVIKVKNKYQARLQVPGDGRGGMRKRKQYSLPGLFDTAKEAAVLLAVIKRDMKEAYGGRVVVPPKQNKQHKARVRQQPQRLWRVDGGLESRDQVRVGWILLAEDYERVDLVAA